MFGAWEPPVPLRKIEESNDDACILFPTQSVTGSQMPSIGIIDLEDLSCEGDAFIAGCSLLLPCWAFNAVDYNVPFTSMLCWISIKLVSVLSILSSLVEIWPISSLTTCLMAAMRRASSATSSSSCRDWDCLVGYCFDIVHQCWVQWVNCSMPSLFTPEQEWVTTG